jgi:hypothetical protein
MKKNWYPPHNKRFVALETLKEYKDDEDIAFHGWMSMNTPVQILDRKTNIVYTMNSDIPDENIASTIKDLGY